jgi:hypothetical protein
LLGIFADIMTYECPYFAIVACFGDKFSWTPDGGPLEGSRRGGGPVRLSFCRWGSGCWGGYIEGRTVRASTNVKRAARSRPAAQQCAVAFYRW